MPWNLNVKVMESCSCAALCPCILGPAKPDQEWCSGVFCLDVTDGNSDGVDLTGAKIFVHFELPGDFISGIDRARLYVDSSLSEEQRAEIDAIFHGERGGLWGGMRDAIKEWLPTIVAPIEISNGEKPGATVEGIGQLTLQPILSEEGGSPTKVIDAPVVRAFGMSYENLAYANGTKFADPDLRAWESLGQGGTSEAVWTG